MRRVKTESSIGDKLKRTRIRKKISVSQVEEATKIRAKFILALESDSWEQIPCEAYGRGYLEKYAAHLQMPVENVMKQYSREREMYARRCQDAQVEFAPKSRLSIPRFLLTPRFFAVLFMIGALTAGGGLLTYQIRRFSSAPFLELATPAQAKGEDPSELVVKADSVSIAGRTAIGAVVHVNSRLVSVGEDGGFRETVRLQKGINAITVEAVDAKGKKTSEVLNVVSK